MPIVQHQLAFARPLAARVRSVRRPFRPSVGQGPYRLPHDVRDRLSAALAPFRNREAAFTLATFLARYHTAPGRLGTAFCIDRRALLGHADLDLTEARIRRAIMTLEAVGFLDRPIPLSGSRYKATEEGLHRRPIAFVFGAEFSPLFHAANKRAQAARGGRKGERRSLPEGNARRPSAVNFSGLKSPKGKSEASPQVNLGDLRKDSGIPAETSQDSALERALQNLRAGVFGKPRGFQAEGGE
jgi:hypothetical protein